MVYGLVRVRMDDALGVGSHVLHSLFIAACSWPRPARLPFVHTAARMLISRHSDGYDGYRSERHSRAFTICHRFFAGRGAATNHVQWI